MISPFIRSRRKQILIDVSTQKDFFLADAGKACTRNHRRVLANLRRVIAWARRKKIPVVSVCDINPNDNGSSVISYCLDGTKGQQKISYTLLNNRVSFPADGSTDLPRDIFKRYRQVILHKRCVDPFDEPRIDRLLSEIHAAEFILIGANAEDTVEAMALGLVQRGKHVSVVTDAVGFHDKRQAELAFRKIKAKGAKLIETKKLAGNSHLKGVGICHCQTCQKHASQKQEQTQEITVPTDF
jgi:nicotinamidase-related amidase